MFEQISIEEWLLTDAGKGWKLIPVGSVVAFDTKGKTIPLVQSVNENKVMNEPDLVLEGAVNGTPAYIGFKEWVSGWGSCFTEYEAIQWKEK